MIDSRVLFPITNAQRSIWQIIRFYPDTRFINLAAVVRIKESVQYELLGKAINFAIQQNDGTRTRILENGSEPLQYFAEYTEKRFDFIDFSYPGGAEKLRQWEKARTRERIELFNSDLYDFALMKISEQEGAFFLKAHHITADLWSMTLLASQILQHYYSLKHGRAIPCQINPSYGDHILSEQDINSSDRFEKHKTYWNQVLSTRPEFTTFNKASLLKCTDAQRKTCFLPANITLGINDFSKSYNVSPFCILFTALAMCIWKLTSKTDIVLSTPILNRSGVKEKNTIGMFTNNVPFRVKLNPELDFTSQVNKVAQAWKTLLKHQRYPSDLILKSYRETQGTTDKLTDVSFSFQNAKFQVEDLDFNAKVVFNDEEINSLAIHVHDRQDLGIYTIDYDYLTEVFSETDISNLHEYLANVLNNSLTCPSSKVSELKILSPEQEHNLLFGFNATKALYPQHTIVSQFERQAATTPDKVAVIFEHNTITYRELNHRANQLAQFLRAKGIRKDSIVGLMVDRSVEMIIAILSVLKAGGAYLPIDPAYPVERIDYMLKDSNCQLLLTFNLDEDHDYSAFQASKFDLKDQNIYKENSICLDEGPRPEDLANVIYTSGSTGAPKGVMVEHRGLNNLVYAMSNMLETDNKTVLSITTVSFDIFFVETILPLVKGMRVVLANLEEATVPYLLLQLIEKHNVDILQTTPSRLKLILNDRWATKLQNLTEIIVGGESFPLQLLRELRKVTKARVFNGYGPTEASVYASIKDLSDQDHITIGKPIINTQIYILDESLKPVPIGTTGEIFISGDGLARGYVNKEPLTKERFVSNPFIAGTRMYKTGDIARWLRNGEIEYIGRNDNQVKIRGFRIELGEIEERLLKHPVVKEVVVICREDETQRKHLCAYLTCSSAVSIKELSEYSSIYLPDYMIPAHFIVLESLPLTPNGKVDRQALPEPDRSRKYERKYAGPRNETEQRLVELWQKTLEVPEVGIDDNLFALGGDSLAILEILSGLFPTDWGLSAQDFYDYPTIRRLSDKVSGAEPASPVKPKAKPISFKAAAKSAEFELESGNILLTGATGFLGVHILYELLSVTSGKVLCLVRGKDPEKRLRYLLEFYFPFLSASQLEDRLVILKGDITLENCGLSESDYASLGEEVDTIIHAAALVKHYGMYDEFERVNVTGVRQIINFCMQYGIKLNYISTMSVSGSYLTHNCTKVRFTENDLNIGQDYQSNVYVRSKFEAENLIGKAVEEGLDATVFRVGLLTGRYRDGQFQQNIEQNAFYRLLKSIVLLEAVPIDILQEQLEFTPVDSCAKAIVAIVRGRHTIQPRFHVFNQKTIKMAEVIRIFIEAGISIKVLPRKSFDSMVTFVSTEDYGKEIMMGIIADPSLKAVFGADSGVQVDSSSSVDFLREMGFIWPEIDAGYLLKVLNYMRNTGFLDLTSTAK